MSTTDVRYESEQPQESPLTIFALVVAGLLFLPVTILWFGVWDTRGSINATGIWAIIIGAVFSVFEPVAGFLSYKVSLWWLFGFAPHVIVVVFIAIIFCGLFLDDDADIHD